MNKRTLVAMMLVLLLVLLSACSANVAEEESPFRGRMHRYPVDVGRNVYVDNVTGVCYFQCSTGGEGITVMLDANGNPLIYKGE
jgi:hypothetical protein